VWHAGDYSGEPRFNESRVFVVIAPSKARDLLSRGWSDPPLAALAEVQLQIPRDVVDDRQRFGNIRVRRVAHRLEAHALEPHYRLVQRQAVLQRNAERPAESLHQPRKRRAFLCHLDEDLAGLAVLK